ncbi:purine-cytosine permease family protein [Kibdelosporangium phytohabitans]|uniref:Nitrate reductase n=1 Tax=Kibdelosporangium phytohabitans TaxID=860235 RepID=A0A0N9I4H0_9PSEU|nr:cytosine permease [Kibdelosporangium phytohabitans]ALG09710.1 nitrate reductase [Kibdelosporangium phytohabitans]MBE1468933.1 purine-cytosine permease-like protein [Kibdelosporangium phytohabitans]
MSPAAESGRASRVEAHGIDVIGDDERHGRARDLFGVWAAPNVSYLSLVVGGALVLMGLELWQTLVVIVAGNLCWILVGVVAVSGPAAGAPSEVITRAVYGIRANRVVIGVNGWFISVCYAALNWSAASVTAFSLFSRYGLDLDTAGKILVIIGIAAVTLVISVYGHATIVKLYPLLSIVLTVVFAVLASFVLGHTDWTYQPRNTLHGVELWAALAAGLALVASAALSYNNSADFARYLPRTTKPAAVAGWTALGAYIPSVLFTVLGALAATTLDMRDPQTALAGMLPEWFDPVFLIAVIIGAIANNAMTIYSAGLAIQAIGIRMRRSRSVLLDGTIGVLLTMYALLVSNFLDAVSSTLQLMVAVLGPMMAIYVADVLLRRNSYDGHALSDETKGGPFWYVGGVNWAGVGALVAGAAPAFACISIPSLYTGFLADAVGGIDLSLPVGLVVAAVTYTVAMRGKVSATADEPAVEAMR